MNHTGITKFLKTYAPDFCWCSVYDLLLMIEQEPRFEDVTQESFKVTISILKKQGWFITKKNKYINPDKRSVGSLYLRVK